MGTDRRDTPSGPHQAVSKNGIDRAQDQQLRDLREDFRQAQQEVASHRSDEEAWNMENAAVHTQLMRSVTRQNVLIGIAAAVFSTFMVWLGTLWVKIDNVEERLDAQHNVDQLRNDAHSFKGEEWGRTMELDIERNRQAVRELERRLDGRRKQE